MDNATMGAIAQIFINNPFDPKNYNTAFAVDPDRHAKSQWFNTILVEMRRFGFTPYEFIRPANNKEKYQPTGEVSLSNYCIVNPAMFRARVLVEIYPNNKDWSHQIVPDFLRAMIDKSMEKYLEDRVLWSLITPMRLFLNLATSALNSSWFDLNVRGGYDRRHFSEVADKKQDEIAQALGITDVACIYKNHMVARANPQVIKERFDLANIPFLEFIGENNKLLNEACRAYKLDIVK